MTSMHSLTVPNESMEGGSSKACLQSLALGTVTSQDVDSNTMVYMVPIHAQETNLCSSHLGSVNSCFRWVGVHWLSAASP